MCESLVHGYSHSSSSQCTESTLGRDARESTVGCSGDWPARKRVADLVRMTRIERLERAWKEEIIRGNLMVATEPLAAKSRCRLPSWILAATAAAGVRYSSLGLGSNL